MIGRDPGAPSAIGSSFRNFPRVGDRLISRPYRYGYTTAFKQLQDNVVTPVATGHTCGNVLLKHDLQTGAAEEHCFENGAAGEPLFVPYHSTPAKTKVMSWPTPTISMEARRIW
jgi:carotenoid cleavage dioxygenase-like enzyme